MIEMANNVSKYRPLRVLHGFTKNFNWLKVKKMYKERILKDNNNDFSILENFPEKKEEFVKEYIDVMLRMEENEDLSGYKKCIVSLANSIKISTELIAKNSTQFRNANFGKLVPILAVIFEIWGENKQVYKPDLDFVKDLAKTRNFKLHRTDIEHLPTKTFYIDTEGYKDNFYGAFVHITKRMDNGYVANIITVDKKGEIKSDAINIKFDENGVSNVDETLSNKDIVDEMAKIYKALFNKELPKKPEELDNDNDLRLIFQLMLYLTSKEPDIQESERTRLTYKKPVGKPKNSFKEVQMYDVGIHYGKTIRAYNKELKESKKRRHNELPDDVRIIKEGTKRKSPRLHYRCAHWQRYRVGKGRTKVITKWIEPIFVGAGKKESTDVVIHKVR